MSLSACASGTTSSSRGTPRRRASDRRRGQRRDLGWDGASHQGRRSAMERSAEPPRRCSSRVLALRPLRAGGKPRPQARRPAGAARLPPRARWRAAARARGGRWRRPAVRRAEPPGARTGVARDSHAEPRCSSWAQVRRIPQVELEDIGALLPREKVEGCPDGVAVELQTSSAGPVGC